MTVATVATAVLLTAVTLNSVCHPGWAAPKDDQPPARFRRYPPAANVYGDGSVAPTTRGVGAADGGAPPPGNPPQRDADGSDSGADPAEDGQDHEDQLDQDDPVSTVQVTAVRGSMAKLPCDIGGGNNDGLPRHSEKSASADGEEKTKTSENTTPEDRAYMVLWFKHRSRSTIRHQNSKTKNKKMSSGGKPLYSYDVRGRPLREALHWSDKSSEGLGTRAKFVVIGADGALENSTKAALEVMNVTEQDAGSYRCRVDFRDSPTRNYRIILRVIVPPDKMTIIYNDVTKIGSGTHHVIGPVPEGSRLVLICKVVGGKPKPRVHWYSADGKITSPYNQGSGQEVQIFGANNNKDDENITTEKLIIEKLNRNHANGTYTCVAVNDDNTVESKIRMTVLINMYLNVQNVRIVGIRPMDNSENSVNNYFDDNYIYNNNNGVYEETANLISGKWYTGECLADGASPKAKIEWAIIGTGNLASEVTPPPTPNSVRVKEETEYSSRIQFKPTPNDDGRKLNCLAYNPENNSTKDFTTKNTSVLLNVQYPPIVKLNLGQTFDPTRIKTGDDVYFECKVLDGGGNKGKKHNHIEWYHNGRSILQNASVSSARSEIKVVLLSAGTLVIRNVGHHHSGQYTCESKNDLGTGRSRPVTLRVQYAPVCADGGPQLVGVEASEKTVRVTCRVRADPADDLVRFQWTVTPGPASNAGELHQQQSSGVMATGALSGSPRNSTAAAGGLAVGELVLPAFTIGVPDAVQYAQDRPSAGNNKPAVLASVNCRATNAVGAQQKPCVYNIIPATPPGALSNCGIRFPIKDQETNTNKDRRHHRSHNGNRKRHRRYAAEELATVSCTAGIDGGVRPVTYSLETYATSDESAPFFGSPEDVSANVHRTHNRGESLAENVTGTVTNNTIVEYRVNRTKLLLKWDDTDNRGNGRYLRLSAYASNRMGRGPPLHFDAYLLKHPWWYNETNENGNANKVAGPTRTSSTDWWETSGSGQSAMMGVMIITVTVAGICIASVLLWRRRDDARLSATAETTAIAANLIATDDRHDKTDVDKPDKRYTLLSEQPLQEQCRNVYPNLCPSRTPQHRHGRGTAGFTTTGAAVDAAPDIMIQPNYGKQCFVSIPPYGIPGPESSV
ncbi:Immunoglobulin subtype,Immunoglobulin-like domain,Immunoglobulin-like fold,Immunoglobulin subtype 2 [Cinara cedri]|uniref:Immunoglobulin subtype,Immunoglobulin-like domain,Immunoglobulin-like fold,Immunoglobulin subtype 2 n=1 Tax=Cinara cedri TaxID=506608 RepID=A0A5E4MQI3_9HEMI|nr:Immunoglobulin subtype,Immunoglobulin-like domain,Immunoglobulin-like fold,Immunoglobulin subtype 2 [Cinara cedri]